MQKVEGSSPFIRFEKSLPVAGFRTLRSCQTASCATPRRVTVQQTSGARPVRLEASSRLQRAALPASSSTQSGWPRSLAQHAANATKRET
jgi:hypothetical protein